MSYTKTDWANLPSTTTPLNATNLNKMENGIFGLYPTSWTNATLSSYITGTVKYIKIGNVVVVVFNDVKIATDISNGTLLVSDLPLATEYQLCVLDCFETPGSPLRIGINTSGQIVSHYTVASASNAKNFYGTLIYLTNE